MQLFALFVLLISYLFILLTSANKIYDYNYDVKENNLAITIVSVLQRIIGVDDTVSLLIFRIRYRERG